MFGAKAIYQGNAQLSSSYKDDVSVFSWNWDTVVENIIFDPTVEDSLAVSFNISQAEGAIGEINLFYSYNYEEALFFVELDESGSNPTTYSGTILGSESGLTINLSVYIEFDDGHVIEELNFDSYTFPVENHKAILQVPAKPFDPAVGETIPIKYCSKENDQAIIRIYNAEGKLVRRAKNEIINAADGINYFDWDGRDKNGNLCPIGLYFVNLQVIGALGGKNKTETVPVVIGTPLN